MWNPFKKKPAPDIEVRDLLRDEVVVEAYHTMDLEELKELREFIEDIKKNK